MEGISRPGKIFIGLIALGGLSMVTYAALERQPWHHYQCLLLFVIAVLASRLKLRLPWVNGNMSVNLPFILVAFVQLNMAAALLIACASGFAQCLPKQGGKLKPVQVLFNISTMAVAAGLASFVIRYGSGWQPLLSGGVALLAAAAAVFFLANTLPVAAIIALSERTKMLTVWSSIFHLSFPYYVASAGITSMVVAASRHVGWVIPVLVLPVMYGIYRCYRLYFGRMVAMTRAEGLVGVDRHSIQTELNSLKTI